MQYSRAPFMILTLLYLGFIVLLACTAAMLPERVAIHFDATGRANGWMSRSTDIVFMVIMGLVLPLILVAIFFSVRFLPPALVNLPRKNYWLAPERRAETSNYIFHHSLWLACLIVCFVGAMHLLVVEANRVTSPYLPAHQVYGVLGTFVLIILIWVSSLLRHFTRVPEAERA